MDRAHLIAILATLLCVGCSETGPTDADDYRLQPPPGFSSVPYPDDNRPTEDRIELGRKLFFDQRLSSDGSVSCASCHLPEKALPMEGLQASACMAGAEPEMLLPC